MRGGLKKTIFSFWVWFSLTIIFFLGISPGYSTFYVYGAVNSPYLRGVGYCHWIPNQNLDWVYTSSNSEVFWSNLEPAKGNFNIDPLVNLIEKYSQNPSKQFWVEIYLAGETPSGKKKYPEWLLEEGAKYVKRGRDGTFVPWDRVFLRELQVLLEAINNKFKERWGENLERKPVGFGGIVVWSGGYYGEMQIYNAPQRAQWEAIAKEYFNSQGKDLTPPSSITVSPKHPFVKEFNKLWFESTLNLARLYAQSFHPKIKLMFQLGNGLYGAYGGGFIEYEGRTNVQVDEAVAYEILKQPWGRSRFLFKYNGWQASPQNTRKKMAFYQWFFKELITRGALGVGFEGGHLSPNLPRSEVEELVNIALGVDNGGTPVDYVCIQPLYMSSFTSYPDLFDKLRINLGTRKNLSGRTVPTLTPQPTPTPKSDDRDNLPEPGLVKLKVRFSLLPEGFYKKSTIPVKVRVDNTFIGEYIANKGKGSFMEVEFYLKNIEVSVVEIKPDLAEKIVIESLIDKDSFKYVEIDNKVYKIKLGDLDMDGYVNFNDLKVLEDYIFTSVSKYDVDKDGKVDDRDVFIISSNI